MISSLARARYLLGAGAGQGPAAEHDPGVQRAVYGYLPGQAQRAESEEVSRSSSRYSWKEADLCFAGMTLALQEGRRVPLDMRAPLPHTGTTEQAAEETLSLPQVNRFLDTSLFLVQQLQARQQQR